MSNPYYPTVLGNYIKLTKAKAEDILADFSAVSSAFDLTYSAISDLELEIIPTGWGVAIDTRWYLTATGTDTYSATPSGTPTAADALSAGQVYWLTVANANTGAATLNLGTSEGAEPIEKIVGGSLTALDAGDLDPDKPTMIVYNASAGKWVAEITTASTTNVSESVPGLVLRPSFGYGSTTTISIRAGAYHHAGASEQMLYWDSALTFTAGSGGSNVWSTNLGASQTHYLYIDDTAVVSLGSALLTAAEFMNSTTAPTWSSTKHGWYKGQDRCIFSFTTNGSSQIEEFYHDGGDMVFYADEVLDLTSTDIDLTWTAVLLTIPAFARLAYCFAENDAALQSNQPTKHFKWRTTGQAGTGGHRLITDKDSQAAVFWALTDNSLYIDIVNTDSDTDKISIRTGGWGFPRGM
jgi:hypothetical protein